MANVKLPQLEPYNGIIQPEDKIFVWEALTGLLKQANVSQLPFNSGGGDGTGGGTGGTGGTGGGTGGIKPATFKIRITDPQYSFNGTDTVINDSRLLGFVDYPVRATQLNNAAFRDNELIYDAFNAQLTILNFSLNSGEFLVIDAPGQANNSGGTYSGLIARLEALERITAPFLPDPVLGINGGMVLWNKPAVDIPAGWQEVVAWRGRMPVGFDPGDTLYDLVGKQGGSKTVTIGVNNLPDIPFNYDGVDPTIRYKRGTTGSDMLSPTNENRTGTIDNPNEPMQVLNPFRVVLFIEYVGV